MKPNQSLLLTTKPLTRLLFTEEPFPDESFVSYVMRLANLNSIPDISWILSAVEIKKSYMTEFKFVRDFNISPRRLAELTGVDEEKFLKLLYLPARESYRGNVIAFGQPLACYLVSREIPKICPPCLSENNYCRKAWELVPVTSCPIHECLLIESCQQCRRRLCWKRPQINICNCRFDLRKSEIVNLGSEEIKFTTYFYQKLRLLPSKKNQVGDSLNELNLNDLLKLLFFIATHFTEKFGCHGEIFARRANHHQIHLHLNQALKIFDNWASNYYNFLHEWREREKNYFVSDRYVYLSGVQLPIKYADFEPFNQALHYYFKEPQYDFMHREFKNFLEKLPPEDFSLQSSPYDAFES